MKAWLRDRQGRCLSPSDQESCPSACFGLPSLDVRTWTIVVVEESSLSNCHQSPFPYNQITRLLERTICLPSLFLPPIYSAQWVGHWAPPSNQNQCSAWIPLSPVSASREHSAPLSCQSFHGILCQCFLSSLTSQGWSLQYSVPRPFSHPLS